MKKVTAALLTLTLITLITLPTIRFAYSHCEIPCGVYGDTMRISMLYENITTVEKSMNKIMELSAESKPNWNQLVRWVGNKEKHADDIQHIVTQYFMTQRLKTANKKYVKILTTLHQMLIHAMKAKQSTDLAHVGHLRHLVAELSKNYFSAEDLKHIQEHHPEGK